ncbi:MAG TPA: VOC family protein [Stenotrophomonas sp.]|jgi:PhnB protein
MKATPYLNFNGDCRPAFERYKQIFGGDAFQITYGEAPPPPEGAPPPPEGCGGEVPASAKDRIMHVTLAHGQEPFLMGSDMPPGMEKKGNGIAVALNCNDNAEAERVFNALSDGASVQMPLGETFWAERFGMLTDRFGTPWLVNGVYKQP